MIGIPIGLFYANVGEWVLHKYVLHRLGRRRGSFWRYHWEHHGISKRNDFRDPTYELPMLGWHPKSKEALSLALLAAAHLPLLPVAPWFTLTTVFCAADYYRKHKRAHQDPEWGRTHLRWHWDHHNNRDPEANYCVTRPWFDELVGTRVPGEA